MADNQHGVCLTGFADEDGVPCLYDQDEERDGIDAALLWDDDADDGCTEWERELDGMGYDDPWDEVGGR